jgi:hypothetical protein
LEVKKALVRKAFEQGRLIDPEDLTDEAVLTMGTSNTAVRSEGFKLYAPNASSIALGNIVNFAVYSAHLFDLNVHQFDIAFDIREAWAFRAVTCIYSRFPNYSRVV